MRKLPHQELLTINYSSLPHVLLERARFAVTHANRAPQPREKGRHTINMCKPSECTFEKSLTLTFVCNFQMNFFFFNIFVPIILDENPLFSILYFPIVLVSYSPFIARLLNYFQRESIFQFLANVQNSLFLDSVSVIFFSRKNRVFFSRSISIAKKYRCASSFHSF